MAKLEIGQKVTTTKYPGVWEVVESDDFMARISRPEQGKRLVPVASCTNFTAIEEGALSSQQLRDLASAAVRPMVMFTSQPIADKMESLGFTESRLYRDLAAELLVHLVRAGVDVVDIVADAMNLIGSEQSHHALYDAAERVKNP